MASTGSSLRDKMFKDLKFWVSHRVPMRERFVQEIKAGGGEVVPLEKQADILIADEYKMKDAPPGSVSWRFIDDSVKHGIIQLKDRYVIGPDPSRPRPVASGGPSRGLRTNFTPADDAALVNFVLSHHQHRTGNVIYQQFAQDNPRHTWQSWQNRWRKKLQYCSPEELERLSAAAPAVPAPEDGAEPLPVLPEEDSSHREPNPSSAALSKQRQRLEVSREDTVHKPSSSKNAGTVPPNTSVRHQSPERRSTSYAGGTAPPNSRKPATSRSVASPDSVSEVAAESTTPMLPTPDTARPRQPVPRGILRNAGSTTYLQEPESTSEQSVVNPNKEAFYRDIKDYMELDNAHINLEPIIAHRQFFLWDLAEAVGEQEKEPEETDWEYVAHRLGYEVEDQKNLELQFQLQDCWETNLRDFSEFIQAFDGGPTTAHEDTIPSTAVEATGSVHAEENAEDLVEEHVIPNTEEREGEEEEEGEGETAAGEPMRDSIDDDDADDVDDEPRLPSAAPLRSSPRKRHLPVSSHSAQAGKRRRLDPNAEIPSTPDAEIATGKKSVIRAVHDAQPSPSVGRSLRLKQLHKPGATIQDSQDDSQDRLRCSGERSPELGSQDLLHPAMIHRIEQLTSEAGSSPAVRAEKGKHVSIIIDNDEDGEDDEEDHEEIRQYMAREQQKQTQQQMPGEAIRPSPSQSLAPVQAPVSKKRTLPSSFRVSSAPTHRQRADVPPAKPVSTRRHSTHNGTSHHISQDVPQRSLNGTPTSLQPRSHGHQVPIYSTAGGPTQKSRSGQQPNARNAVQEAVKRWQMEGYKKETILEALRATTMKTGRILQTTIESLAAGRGIPDRSEGIWTARDDEGVRLLIDAGKDIDRDPLDSEEHAFLNRAKRQRKHLEEKHTREGLAIRKQFISDEKLVRAKRRESRP